MRVDIREVIETSGLNAELYAGKRAVRDLVQPGTFKSHSVVYDWRDPMRIEVKAGLGGKDLPAADLAKYPVSFQSATFFDIDVENTTARREDSEDEEEDRRGKGSASGGGGLKKKKEDQGLMKKMFGDEVEGRLAEAGDLVKAVVMGMEIAKGAMEGVFKSFMAQVQHAKVAATDLLAKAGSVTKFTPPGFMQARGDETGTYHYDRQKNEAMFTGLIPTMT